MATASRPARARAAQRVIEVLDFFDEQHRQATVMDIARRYNRPQSSTSELLASLVDMGLLYKDCVARSYTLTPRAAILGSLSQPRLVRDGSLCALIDDVSATTRLGVALIGMVGPNAQVFRWRPGSRGANVGRGFAGGAQEALTATAAGWLLLSTIAQPRRDGLIRRLNAEAPDEGKFNSAEMGARVRECGQRGFSTGPSGFGASASSTAILLDVHGDEHPMALALVHDTSTEVEPADLVAQLRSAVSRCIEPAFDGPFHLPPTEIGYGLSAANAA